MKIIIKNKTYWIAILFSVFFANLSFANSSIVYSLPIFGKAKYSKGFTNFEYVNPNAPKGGKITLPAYAGFDNFNSYIFKGIAAHETSSLLNDSLGVVASDDPSTVYPLIAKAFEMPKDKSYIGFILDENAKFSNGDKITADDVIFSFNILISKGSPIYKMYYADVASVKKIADNHIRFIFKKNTDNRDLPLILAGLPVFSEKFWEGKDFSKPVLEPQLGNGAYVVQDFEVGKYIVLKRDDNYWAKDLPSIKGFFNFDEIRYDYYQDTTVTLQALFAGNIDVREEYIAKNWVTGYDNDLLKSKVIKKEKFKHNKTAILQHFAFNLRKDKFKEAKVREAISLAFNFEWANEKLFYNQYKRLTSTFTNSGMEADKKPVGKEYDILKKAGASDDILFNNVPVVIVNNDYMMQRKNLRKAVVLLKEAGYDFVNGKMTNLATNQPLEFEVLNNSSSGAVFTRVMLPFIKSLEKIGIKVFFRTIEVNSFKNRMDNFDYDVAILSFAMPQFPGAEQRELWGSKAKDVKGGYNYSGVSSKLVDNIIEEINKAKNIDDYKASVRAFDRVLRHGHYLIPQWYSPESRVAYWDKFAYPQADIGFRIHTWWAK